MPGNIASVAHRATWRLAFAIALVSAAALAYQLLLMRWLAVAHWSPFAAMIISLALLGHGASGTWLSLWPAARERFDWLFPVCALLFALTSVAALAVARAIPFNGLELVWNPQQLGWLAALYLVLALPFGFAASCFGLAFARHGSRIPALYGADLIGAGMGAVAAAGLAWWPVERGLVLAALGGALAAVVSAPRVRTATTAAAIAILGLLLVLPSSTVAPPVNEFKGLAKALLLPGAHVIAQRHGPYGWLAVVASPQVPLRHAPGLSLSNVQEPPPQLGVFTDGDALSPIVRVGRDPGALAYLERMTSALPYRMRPRAAVLILGAGGGQDLLQALSLGAHRVDVVEVDPQRLALLRDTFDAWAGRPYHDSRVRTHVAEPRAWARATRTRHDLIVLGNTDSLTGGGAGAQAAAEQYVLTVQAWGDMYARLGPGGLLALTRYAKQPPRDELKLFATAVAALRAQGVRTPGAQLAMIRGWDASTLLIKRGAFEAVELQALRNFADTHGFDLAYLPGMRPDEANRYNALDRDHLSEGAHALVSPRASAYLRDYKFAIAPATDDRPYFGDFFRWRSLPELWRLRAQGGAVLLDTGYVLVLAALAQAVPLALLLIVLPLFALRRSAVRPASTELRPWRLAAYFIGLGLAFLIVEIASLSRLVLLVGHPLVAATTGLAGFLFCAGLGSLYAQRWLSRLDSDAAIARATGWAVAAIALGLAWQLLAFEASFAFGAGWPVAVRALLGLAGIAPLAFAMGLPFPLGLSRVARAAPDWVPWAWALNGFASVVAALAAVLLGMAIGLRASLLCAISLYAFAAWVWRAPAAATRTHPA